MFDDTTTITPKPKRHGRAAVWVLVGILAGAAVLGGLHGAAKANSTGPLPTNPPSPSAPATTTPSAPSTVVGTWRIIRVPGVQTGIHVPGERDNGARPVPSVVTQTVPVPGPTVTVPGPEVIVRCTVTVTAPNPSADPSATTIPTATRSTSAPVCTTATATPTP